MALVNLLVDNKKHTISMRLDNTDRANVQSLAARLYVKESEIYRLAINFLLNRTHKLNNTGYAGSDLLPLFIDLKTEMDASFSFKKHQLSRIINSKNVDPDKVVDMFDIELLLQPNEQLRQFLLLRPDALLSKDPDIKIWFKNYLYDKYLLDQEESSLDAATRNRGTTTDATTTP